MPTLPIGSTWGRWALRQLMAFFPREKQHQGIVLKKQKVAKGGEIRLYIPENRKTDAGLLWIHGGGLVIGNARQDDYFCATTARQLGIVVISAEYRLAPEYPFPTALNDCYAVWQWIQTSATVLNINPNRIVIGGQSAGGGIAASLVQRLHDEGGICPIAQWLFCPMLDDRTATRNELEAIGHFVWNNASNRIGWHSYLGAEFGALHVSPYAVPARRIDLSGLPPAWIGTSDIELFFDENKAYAEQLMQCGVACTLDIVPAVPHGFESIAPLSKVAQAYLARSREWLQGQLT